MQISHRSVPAGGKHSASRNGRRASPASIRLRQPHFVASPAAPQFSAHSDSARPGGRRPLLSGIAGRVLNSLTIDLEDWIQSVFDHNYPLTDRFRHNTHRVLELLNRHGVKATFFVLGLAAEKAPDLIREIAAAGHEVQSHGFAHRPVYTQSPTGFRADVQRSKNLLEDLIGRPVVGYRAPAFSIDARAPWAFDVLAETGFQYDSSIFPVRMRRYGDSASPRTPYFLRTEAGSRLLELPVASFQAGPIRLPAGGGGYLRLFPYRLTRAAVRQLNAAGQPAVIYLHPYEFAPEEFGELAQRIPWKLRMAQTLGRRHTAGKVVRLLKEFHFAPLAKSVSSSPAPLDVRWPFPSQADTAQLNPALSNASAAYCVAGSQT